MRDSQQVLVALFSAAVAGASPALLAGRLPDPPVGRTVVVGAGKAAAAMARVVEDEWPAPLEGLVVTRRGHGVRCSRIAVAEASHPVPDIDGGRAARRAVALVRDLSPDDLVICLLSGGGSALLSLPVDGLSLSDKQALTRDLLRSGAPIEEINCVRKHLSAVKGGRLAALAHPARVATFLISDVVGDDPSTVASGPTVPDPTTFSDALDILRRRNVEAGERCLDILERGSRGEIPETPKPGDPAFRADTVVTIATSRDALQAAARHAEALGLEAILLGEGLEGEARQLGREHARAALELAAGGRTAAGWSGPGSRPQLCRTRSSAVLLSGGETTVTVRGEGRGGPNLEYLLGLALELNGHEGISAIACDTDGIDGSEDNAGAIVTPDTLERAQALGLDPATALENNDTYGFFEALGDLVVTGPTLTNVNDLRAILVHPGMSGVEGDDR